MEFELTTLVAISTHCADSCKSNYHTTTTAPAPIYKNKRNVVDVNFLQINLLLILIGNFSRTNSPLEIYVQFI